MSQHKIGTSRNQMSFGPVYPSMMIAAFRALSACKFATCKAAQEQVAGISSYHGQYERSRMASLFANAKPCMLQTCKSEVTVCDTRSFGFLN